jgi:hypothetical protein
MGKIDLAAFSLAGDPACYPAFFRGAVFWGCFSAASFCAPPAIGNSISRWPALRFAAFLPFGASAAACFGAVSCALSTLWRSAAIRSVPATILGGRGRRRIRPA